MKITIKLFALLAKYLPEHAVRNEAEIEVEDGTTVHQVFVLLNLPSEHCHLVLVDGVYVEQTDRETRQLKEGEALAVWPPVAGG